MSPGKTFDDAKLKADRMPLYETFIGMYMREVAELAKRGVRCSYVAREDNLAYMTGKLMIAEHVRRNAAHGERFYVRHDEFLVDRPENRLIGESLTILRLS